MNNKEAGVIIFLLIVLLPMHQIHAQNSFTEKIVGRNTPTFITKFIVLAINTIEEFRSDIAFTCESKKEEVSTQINSINSATISSRSILEISRFLKAFKYIELVMLIFLSFLFGNKIAFYFSLLVLIFLIVRLMWHASFRQ